MNESDTKLQGAARVQRVNDHARAAHQHLSALRGFAERAGLTARVEQLDASMNALESLCASIANDLSEGQ